MVEEADVVSLYRLTVVNLDEVEGSQWSVTWGAAASTDLGILLSNEADGASWSGHAGLKLGLWGGPGWAGQSTIEVGPRGREGCAAHLPAKLPSGLLIVLSLSISKLNRAFKADHMFLGTT